MTGVHSLPEGWQYDPYWRAAARILDGFATDDARIWAHISTTGLDYPGILAEGWSGGQRRILQAASSLWSDTPVSLLDLVAGLDEGWWQRITEALAIMRDGLR